MRKVIGYLVDYQKERFEWQLYLAITLFLVICIGVNYAIDFEDAYIDTYYGQPILWLWMFLFQLFPYLAVCAILLVFGKVDNWAKSSDFWLRVLVGFSILAFDRSFYGTEYLSSFFSEREFYFIAKCLRLSASLVTALIPLLVVYYLLERHDQPKHWYGMSFQRFDVQPYFFMLLLMSVIIGISSFAPDIQDHYPRFQKAGIEAFTTESGWPRWLVVTVYELCYGTDFLTVELFFRGYLIFAFTRILGPYVVLPMAATYCFFHFGKPLGESIGSIFGGCILGIIALYSRNIWGGIMIHLGVAWLMELFGWLQSKF